MPNRTRAKHAKTVAFESQVWDVLVKRRSTKARQQKEVLKFGSNELPQPVNTSERSPSWFRYANMSLSPDMPPGYHWDVVYYRREDGQVMTNPQRVPIPVQDKYNHKKIRVSQFARSIAIDGELTNEGIEDTPADEFDGNEQDHIRPKEVPTSLPSPFDTSRPLVENEASVDSGTELSPPPAPVSKVANGVSAVFQRYEDKITVFTASANAEQASSTNSTSMLTGESARSMELASEGEPTAPLAPAMSLNLNRMSKPYLTVTPTPTSPPSTCASDRSSRRIRQTPSTTVSPPPPAALQATGRVLRARKKQHRSSTFNLNLTASNAGTDDNMDIDTDY